VTDLLLIITLPVGIAGMIRISAIGFVDIAGLPLILSNSAMVLGKYFLKVV
jgi:hypothetical protein